MDIYMRNEDIMTLMSRNYIIFKTHKDRLHRLYGELNKIGRGIRGAYILKKGSYGYVGEGTIKSRLTKHMNDKRKEEVLEYIYVILRKEGMTKDGSLTYEGYLCRLLEDELTLINEQTTYDVTEELSQEEELKYLLKLVGVYKGEVSRFKLEHNGEILVAVREGKINYIIEQAKDGYIPNEMLGIGDLCFESLEDIKKLFGGIGQWMILQ